MASLVADENISDARFYSSCKSLGGDLMEASTVERALLFSGLVSHSEWEHDSNLNRETLVVNLIHLRISCDLLCGSIRKSVSECSKGLKLN